MLATLPGVRNMNKFNLGEPVFITLFNKVGEITGTLRYERMDGIYIEIIEKNKVFPHGHRGNLEDYVKRRGIPK